MRVDDELLTLAPLSSVLVEPDSVRQLFNDTDADALWLVAGAPAEAANTLEMTPELLARAVPRRPEGTAAGALGSNESFPRSAGISQSRPRSTRKICPQGA